jgi:hypothetical protein
VNTDAVLNALATHPAVPWTTTEVWRAVQSLRSVGIADDMVCEQLESNDWPAEEEACWALSDKIRDEEIEPVGDLLETLWREGVLVRIRTHGGGGEWAVPGTPASASGVVAANW